MNPHEKIDDVRGRQLETRLKHQSAHIVQPIVLTVCISKLAMHKGMNTNSGHRIGSSPRTKK